MAFENDTNAGRVRKMVETLALIRKSAEANRAEPEALTAMLRPLADALSEIGIATAPPHPAGAARTGQGGIAVPQWASVRQMAEDASLPDLTAAMAIYLDRIDEALS